MRILNVVLATTFVSWLGASSAAAQAPSGGAGSCRIDSRGSAGSGLRAL